MDRVPDVAAEVESTVDSLVTVLENARVAQTSVPPTQLRVLTAVSRSTHLNVSRLAEALDVLPSSASRLCDRLEATGLLRREPDPRDRREVRLLLTPVAGRLLAEWHARRREALQEVLERMMPAARQDLVKALAAFEAAAQDGQPSESGLRTA